MSGCSGTWKRLRAFQTTAQLSKQPSKLCTTFRAATAGQESIVSVEDVKVDILKALSQLQETVEGHASDKLADADWVLVLLISIAVGSFFVVDYTTGIVDEAIELFEYDRNPRFLPGPEGELEQGGALQPGRKLGRADSETSTLMLQSGDEESSVVPVKEQLVLEQAIRQTVQEVASREEQITFLLLAWALLVEGTEAFFRTPDAPLQP